MMNVGGPVVVGSQTGAQLPRSFFELCAPSGRPHSHTAGYGTPNVPHGKEAGRASQLRAPRATCLLEVQHYQHCWAWSSRSFLLLSRRRRGVSAGPLVATVSLWCGPRPARSTKEDACTPDVLSRETASAQSLIY
ncbi:hypothetical protein NDU88_003336 [Pleurodeles waltl]|uniref:Uncharacterized protein n=1 Tax=Pleurodeles waltl TaxID=8319 RepID=A0AAV7VH56_PLEWA|nr:hypothetical protein NDU88_003336 [Pleurodeles waltl]